LSTLLSFTASYLSAQISPDFSPKLAGRWRALRMDGRKDVGLKNGEIDGQWKLWSARGAKEPR
jgi:hypothetical protein